MKILFVTTIGLTMSFFKNLISDLTSDGHKVDIACNDSCEPVLPFFEELGCQVYSISCSRSPLSKNNLTAIKQIKKLVNENHYDIVHCHTPVAAACTRIACRKARKSGTKVFYTAHGFHFYKGAPLKNWLIFYPIEKICSYFTDKLITINKEDYVLAQHKMKADNIEYVNGVGIDVERFASATVDKTAKRHELGIPDDAFLLISVGELNPNKNHEVVLRAISKLKDKDVYYIIAGDGRQREHLISLANECGIADRFSLLGRRDDIPALLKASDVFIFPSIREGLPVSVMEAMAAGMPVVTSRNRGSNDLLENTDPLCFCNCFNESSFSHAISELKNNPAMAVSIGEHNKEIAEKFDVNKINDKMLEIYEITSDRSASEWATVTHR